MKKFRFTLVSIFFCLLFGLPAGYGGTVRTVYGEQTGRIITRQFDTLIVTILSPDRRIFQYADKDVQKITAESKTLVSAPTSLQEIASATGEKVVDLAPGMEVKIVKNPEDSDWVEVQVWGSTQGWLPKSILTDEVVFPGDKPQVVLPPFMKPIQTESPTDVPSTLVIPESGPGSLPPVEQEADEE